MAKTTQGKSVKGRTKRYGSGAAVKKQQHSNVTLIFEILFVTSIVVVLCMGLFDSKHDNVEFEGDNQIISNDISPEEFIEPEHREDGVEIPVNTTDNSMHAEVDRENVDVFSPKEGTFNGAIRFVISGIDRNVRATGDYELVRLHLSVTNLGTRRELFYGYGDYCRVVGTNKSKKNYNSYPTDIPEDGNLNHAVFLKEGETISGLMYFWIEQNVGDLIFYYNPSYEAGGLEISL